MVERRLVNHDHGLVEQNSQVAEIKSMFELLNCPETPRCDSVYHKGNKEW